MNLRNRKKNGGCQELGGGWGMRSCLMGIESQFGNMKKFWRSMTQQHEYT